MGTHRAHASLSRLDSETPAHRADVIRWTIDRLMTHAPSVTPTMALTVEREARAVWGGQRIDYIRKTCSADLRAARIGPAP